MKAKPKLSVFWAASCGGCEIAVTNLHERILDVDANFDLVFCPCLLDTKKKDVEALKDGSIAVTLFNGAIRNEENEEMAHLLRRKSAVLVAFGSCAVNGSIPALSNLHSREDHLRAIYGDNPTIDNPDSIVPREEVRVREGTLRLPRFDGRVRTLAQVVDVDYSFPGCPPESHQIWGVIDLLIKNGPLPPKGSVIGAGRKTVCDECSKKRSDKRIKRLYRTWEIIPDKETCLLEQGLLCMGVATRDGCGAVCPQVQMPCAGCYGPPEGVRDQGAKMASALGSMLDIEPLKKLPESDIDARVDAVLDAIPDYAGTFYKFSLAGSMLQRAVRADERGGREHDLD